MESIEVSFSCGTRAKVSSFFVRETEYGVGASDSSLWITERIIQRNHEFASDFFDEPIYLIRPNPTQDSEGRYQLPSYWCAAELHSLVPVPPDDYFSRCIVQWYHGSLLPDLNGELAELIKSLSWSQAANGNLRQDS